MYYKPSQKCKKKEKIHDKKFKKCIFSVISREYFGFNKREPVEKLLLKVKHDIQTCSPKSKKLKHGYKEKKKEI